MTAKNFCLRHYPDATAKKCQSGTQKGVEYRITYNKTAWNVFQQIVASSELSGWVILRKLIEQENDKKSQNR